MHPTIPLYLLALIVALAATPTNIFQVCAWNVGTIEVEPWRRKRSTLLTRLTTVMHRVRQLWRSAGGLPGAVGVACLIVTLVCLPVHAAPHLLLAIPAAAAATSSPATQLKALRQRAADLNGERLALAKQRAAIGEAAIAEKRALTDDERTKFAALKTQIDALDAQAADVAQLLDAAVAANEAERTYTGTAAADADAAAAEASARAAGLHVPRIHLVERPKRGLFGRQLQAVRNIYIKQASDADRDAVRAMAGPVLAGPTGLNTDVPSEGGFLIAPERSNTILQRSYMIGQILSRVFRMPIGADSNGMKIPAIDETSRADNSRFGGIASGWLGQGNTLTSGKPKFREMDLKLRKVGAFVYATDEQLADAIALEAWISRYLPLELMFRTEDAVVNGTGGTMPIGVLNSGAAITITRQTAARVLYEDVSAMWARMWAGSRGNAVWLCDQSVEPELEKLNIAIGTAGVLAPIWRPAGNVPNAGMVGGVAPEGSFGGGPGSGGNQIYGTLYGRPVIPVEYCAALGTVGDIILVNFDEYTVIDKGEVEQAVSLHVAFLTDEAVFRFLYRVDGQFNWNAPLTPKNGGNTLSPLITLT